MAKKFVSLDRLGTFLDQVKKLIPTVNNPTITIKQAGSNKGTFTLNQSGATTIELTDNNTTYSAATTSAAGLMSAADKSKLGVTNIAYATCSTASATAAKVATISGNGNWTLTTGAIVCVKFTYSNSASNCTLNVNNTGAKSLYYSTGVYTGTSADVCGYSNIICYYMYDGTYWVWLGKGYDVNSTYNPMTLGGGYGTCATAEATTAKVATLSYYLLVVGGKPVIKFTYAVPANATLNINSRGAKAIYFQGAAITAGVIEAGDLVTFIYDGLRYHILSIDKTASLINKTQADLEASWNASSIPDVLDLLDTSKFVPYSGATGDVDLGSNSLTTSSAITVGEPTSSSNAATKNYVDSQWTTVHSW